MDLGDLWQEHKAFIVAAAAIVLVLLIGSCALDDVYPVGSLQADNVRAAGALGRAEEVPDRMVRELREEVEELESRRDQLIEAMHFEPLEEFVLPPGEANPRSFAWSTLRNMQALVDVAERQDIRLPDNLGLREAIPTDPDQIRRTLRALNIVGGVVLQSIAAQVHSVDRIQIEDEPRRRAQSAQFVEELRVEFEIVGSEESLRAVLGGIVQDPGDGTANFLEVSTPTRIEPFREEQGLLRLRLTVAGLTIQGDEESSG